jgi:hypothetical protein
LTCRRETDFMSRTCILQQIGDPPGILRGAEV